jgi:flagellar hook-length control protein FliK
LQVLQVINYEITKLHLKNEKLKPTNNNVSKFTSNKTHAGIAQIYKLQVYKLQNKIK